MKQERSLLVNMIFEIFARYRKEFSFNLPRIGDISDTFFICRWMLGIMSRLFVEIFYLLMFKDWIILGE